MKNVKTISYFITLCVAGIIATCAVGLAQDMTVRALTVQGNNGDELRIVPPAGEKILFNLQGMETLSAGATQGSPKKVVFTTYIDGSGKVVIGVAEEAQPIALVAPSDNAERTDVVREQEYNNVLVKTPVTIKSVLTPNQELETMGQVTMVAKSMVALVEANIPSIAARQSYDLCLRLPGPQRGAVVTCSPMIDLPGLVGIAYGSCQEDGVIKIKVVNPGPDAIDLPSTTFSISIINPGVSK